VLIVDEIVASRGDSEILHGVSLEVRAGEIVSVIGRNGMGKTTLLRSILGLTRITRGKIRFDGHDITGAPTHAVARSGIGVVPEGRGIFATLTVLENLKMGLPSDGRRGLDLEPAFTHFPFLAERSRDRAGVLSGGQQQQLSIARALVARPKLLVLDEFSDGIQPNVVAEIAATLRGLNEDGIMILLVEQNARLALSLAHRAYILEKGDVVHQGLAAGLLTDEETLRRFLVV
jgi:branched-chain amino acid transport system ATP-binding protein